MAKAYQDRISTQLRIDPNVYEKIKVIADEETRSVNSQMEYFIKKGVAQYELEHGPIVLDEYQE